jgi:tetratricopeptide (TPR) repeat protein
MPPPPTLSRTTDDQPLHPRASKKWTLRPAPSPLTSPFEGASILDEVEAPLAVELWQRLRDVQLWTEADATARLALFERAGANAKAAAAALAESLTDGHLKNGLETLRTLCEGGLPEERTLITACLALAEWAQREGYTSTCVEYAEAAARLRVRDPDLSFNAGRANRRKAAYERAEAWFDRAHGLARRARDPIALADSLLGWGNLEYQRGELDTASKLYFRAWRAARKAKVRALGAAAQHNLLLLRFDESNFDEATRHAALAASLYPVGHRRIPYLAHDTALVWMNEGYHEAALRVFLACIPHIEVPVERVQLWANIARAAGALRDSNRFYEAWDIVSIGSTRPGEFVAISLVNVAEGARSLGLRRQARVIAGKAKEFARLRGEKLTEAAADRLLTALRSGGAPDALREHPEHVGAFSTELLELLSKVGKSR